MNVQYNEGLVEMKEVGLYGLIQDVEFLGLMNYLY